MIKNVLTHIGGVGIYGIISICLFFVMFLAMLLWTVRLKRSYLDSMRQLPLADDSASHPESLHPAPPSCDE